METQQTIKPLTLKNLFTETTLVKRLSQLLSAGLGLILLTWLLSQLEWTETLATLRTVPPLFLLIGFLSYILSFYLRALRFRMLLPPEHPRNHLFPIVLVHYTALNIIPARLGELSYVYLLSKVNRMPVGISLSSLLVARVFDQLALALLFLIASGFVEIASPWLRTIRVLVGGFLLITLVILLVLFAYKDRYVAWLKDFLHWIHWDHFKIIHTLIHTCEEIVAALHNIYLIRQGAGLLSISAGIWLSIFSVNYFLLRAFQAPLTYIEIMFTSTCIILLSVLPLQMLGGLGIHETTLVFLAEALGAPRTVVITAALSSHVLATLYLCLFGIYGFWRLYSFLRAQPHYTPLNTTR